MVFEFLAGFTILLLCYYITMFSFCSSVPFCFWIWTGFHDFYTTDSFWAVFILTFQQLLLKIFDKLLNFIHVINDVLWIMSIYVENKCVKNYLNLQQKHTKKAIYPVCHFDNLEGKQHQFYSFLNDKIKAIETNLAKNRN